MQFLPYQRRWILDETPLKLYEKSRRIGITYATSYRAVRKCLTRRNFTQWVSSRDQLTAREFIDDYVARWLQALNVASRHLGPFPIADPASDLRGWTATFPATGSRIVSLSSTPEAFAGKGGDVLLDEFDLHRDPANLLDMALPCTTWGGQLEIVSAYNPAGSPNSLFARLVAAAAAENPMGWSLHRTDLPAAVDEGLAERVAAATGRDLDGETFVAELRARCRDETAWRSQYLCQPADDDGALLPHALIRACETTSAVAAGEHYAGMDVGRQHDLSVIWILAQVGDVAWTRHIEVLAGAPFQDQLRTLETLLHQYAVRRVAIDRGGIGAMLAEEATERFGSTRVEPLAFTPALKEDLALRVRRAAQEQRLRLPADQPALRDDLHRVRRHSTAAGNVRYVAARDTTGHADRFWALALALHAAADPPAAPRLLDLAAEAEPPHPQRPDHRDDHATPRRSI